MKVCLRKLCDNSIKVLGNRARRGSSNIKKCTDTVRSTTLSNNKEQQLAFGVWSSFEFMYFLGKKFLEFSNFAKFELYSFVKLGIR